MPETFKAYRRLPVSPLAVALADAEKIIDTKDREAAIQKARKEYADGTLKLGYPEALTKRYRVFWDESGQLAGDPEEEHESGSTTMGGPAYAFESDDLEEVRQMVKDLKLKIIKEDEAAL